MGAIVLGIVVAVVVLAGVLVLLARRHVAQADRRDTSGDGGGMVVIPGADPPGSGLDCGIGADCGGGGGGGD